VALNKDELIDYAIRAGAPLEVVENQSIEDEGDMSRWKSLADPTDEDYLWNEDEYYNQRKVSKRLFFG
jgi:hypothetical protein